MKINTDSGNAITHLLPNLLIAGKHVKMNKKNGLLRAAVLIIAFLACSLSGKATDTAVQGGSACDWAHAWSLATGMTKGEDKTYGGLGEYQQDPEYGGKVVQRMFTLPELMPGQPYYDKMAGIMKASVTSHQATTDAGDLAAAAADHPGMLESGVSAAAGQAGAAVLRPRKLILRKIRGMQQKLMLWHRPKR